MVASLPAPAKIIVFKNNSPVFVELEMYLKESNLKIFEWRTGNS